jgi:hypothetical protein
MQNFQMLVIYISITLLVIALIIVAIFLYNQGSSVDYPPVLAKCPDYWLDTSNGQGSDCYNYKKLGDPSCKRTMDFSTGKWQGKAGLCKKSKWAKECDITWDGISNRDLCN